MSDRVINFVCALVIGAPLSYLFATWLWPWVGPMLFEPCPKFLGWGVAYWTFSGFVKSWALATKQDRDKRIDALLRRFA